MKQQDNAAIKSMDFDSLCVQFSRFIAAQTNLHSNSNKHLKRSDVHQEVLLGLWKAHNKWEPSKGLNFITYSEKWISSRIQALLRENRLLKFTRDRVKSYMVSDFVTKFIEQYHYEPSFDEIAAGLNITRGQAEIHVMSCNALKTCGIGELEEIIDTADEYGRKDVRQFLLHILAQLKPIYRDVLMHKFGINTEAKTLNEIAKMYNVSRQAIGCREKIAIKKMQKLMSEIDCVLENVLT